MDGLLVNEIHGICYELDNAPDPKDYDADRVVGFLNSRRVSPQLCIGIRNLFDRRNTNQVSHPGSEKYATWGVAAEEYEDYLAQVGACLELIL